MENKLIKELLNNNQWLRNKVDPQKLAASKKQYVDTYICRDLVGANLLDVGAGEGTFSFICKQKGASCLDIMKVKEPKRKGTEEQINSYDYEEYCDLHHIILGVDYIRLNFFDLVSCFKFKIKNFPDLLQNFIMNKFDVINFSWSFNQVFRNHVSRNNRVYEWLFSTDLITDLHAMAELLASITNVGGMIIIDHLYAINQTLFDDQFRGILKQYDIDEIVKYGYLTTKYRKQ